MPLGLFVPAAALEEDDEIWLGDLLLVKSPCEIATEILMEVRCLIESMKARRGMQQSLENVPNTFAGHNLVQESVMRSQPAPSVE